MSRERYGVRAVEPLEGGGVVVWLYPGGADLDEALLVAAEQLALDDVVEWFTTGTPVAGEGPYLPMPALPAHREWTAEEHAAWAAYYRHEPPRIAPLLEERATHLPGDREVEVGHYRRFPWCTCGEEHGWHVEPSTPGPGAMLALLVWGAW